MEKKMYESPKALIVNLVNERLLDVISPGKDDEEPGSRRDNRSWSED